MQIWFPRKYMAWNMGSTGCEPYSFTVMHTLQMAAHYECLELVNSPCRCDCSQQLCFSQPMKWRTFAPSSNGCFINYVRIKLRSSKDKDLSCKSRGQELRICLISWTTTNWHQQEATSNKCILKHGPEISVTLIFVYRLPPLKQPN